MIDAEHARLMARYNKWQNENLYAAAAGLSEAERKQDRGAFFRSIHGTLSHILWADRVWMARFDGWDRPDTPNAESGSMIADFATLRAERERDDQQIISWTDQLLDGDLAGPLEFFSGALKSNISMPLWTCLTHFFNHQTHHRGQAHAMITAAGGTPHDTDLFLMSEAQNAPA
ncbi:MAG: DinB family protein [Hyphomonas sp.]|nr:DinB family protein [Hyphomonas sp.]